MTEVTVHTPAMRKKKKLTGMSESPPRTLLIAQRSTAYACSVQYQSVEMSGEACWLLPGMLFARKFEAGWDDPVGCSTGSFFSPTRR